MQNFALGLLLTLNHVQAFFNLSSVKYCINTPLFNSLNAGKLCMLLLPSADLSFKSFFQKQNQCQTVWIQIRTYILSVLIWVQTICKGYQQTTKVTLSKERVICQNHI